MKNKYKSKIYILKDIKKMAIKLYLNSNNIQNYYFDENDMTEKILQNSLSESNKSKSKNKSKDLKIFLFFMLLILYLFFLKKEVYKN
jgi:cytoskeletal protein RodZ